ncbi:hypothetical protein ACHHRT_11905 [Desulfurivibrio sp. D14AmB]|uniref:hypothetical protein n=1 Tax=Desulfurivibrio sp. D14AmB TaxID=3374370 RepID=UPI00376F0CC3
MREQQPAAPAIPARILILLGTVLLLAWTAPAHPFAPYPSHYRWRTLTTDNFAIHFPHHLAPQAEHTARIAEEVHAKINSRLAWTPRGRTRVIISDHLDYANAAATSFPYNTVYLLLRPAAPGEELADYEEWLTLLFVHEYLHIAHLDQVRGGNRVARALFGRIATPWTFPNWFSPQWLVEGLATYEESALTGRGRTGSAYFEMIVRMAALEDQFPTLGRMQGFQASWPGGYSRYVFGAAFLEYLTETYGEERLFAQAADYAGRALPFRLHASFTSTMGKGPKELWRQWRQVETERAAAFKQRVVEEGETAGQPLTRRGYRIGAPRFSPDGRFLAYSEAGARQWPALWLLDLASGKERQLTDALGSTGLSFSPDGRYLAFARWERRRSFQLYADLYLYDLKEQRLTRLTTGARLRDPDFHPDGSRLIAVREGEGTTTLVLVDPQEGRITPLRQEEQPVVYGRPRWSPDGERLVVDRWRRGRTGLEILAADGGESRVLLERADSTPAWPVWSGDGRQLYFTLAAAKVHNIHRLDPATGELARVTNVVGGAFEPALCPRTGRLVFADYSARGFDLQLLENHGTISTAPAQQETASRERGQRSTPSAGKPAASDDAQLPAHRPYLAGATLLPRGWLPLFSVDEEGGNYGFSTWGADALHRHRFEAAALYGSASDRWSWAISYRNHWFFPILELSASDLAVNHGNLWTPPEKEPGHRPLPDYWERRRDLRATLLVPLLQMRWGLTGRLGVIEQRLTTLSTLPTGEEAPATGVLRGTTLGLTFANREWPRLAIAPTRGGMVQARWNHFSSSLESDFELDEFLGDLRGYGRVPFLRGHLWGWWLKGGLAEGDRLLQRRFQLGGFWTPEELLGQSEGVFALRGYPRAVQRGDRILRGTVEYRLPLAYHENGPAIFPLFFDRSHLTIFAEGGAAWDGSWHGAENDQEIKSSLGVEYKLDLVFAHLLPLNLRVGMAYRLDSDVEAEDRSFFYLGFIGHQF